MITIEEAQHHPVWKQLTGKQQGFITSYLTNGNDGAQAVLQNYSLKPEQALGYSTRLLGQPKIRQILGEVNPNRVSRKEFLELVARYLRDRNMNVQTFYKLADMYRCVAGWSRKNNKDVNVDDMVKRLEQRSQV